MSKRSAAVLTATMAILLAFGTTAQAGDLWNKLFRGDEIEGSGTRVTQERDVKEFTRISTAGGFDITVVVGGKQSIKITLDDNLIDHIETKVRRQTLEISTDDISYSCRKACLIEITVKELERVNIAGSGDVDVENLNGESFDFHLSGSGDLTAEGKVDELDINISGSGSANTRALIAKAAEVSISGSGDVQIYASESFSGSVSGSGNIKYYGDPKHASSSVSGSGKVTKK